MKICFQRIFSGHATWTLLLMLMHAVSSQDVLNESTVTVVMLNWQRPENARKIIATYVKYQSVAEIIIWMCKEETRFALSHQKVRIIDDVSANDKYGLSTRFHACLLSKTHWVFIQDDDHFMREAGLLRMMKVKALYPNRIIGAFGRDWPRGAPPQYLNERSQAAGPCRIILTILMLTDVETCKAFWDLAPLVDEFVRKHSKPLWNGEDIFISLVSYKLHQEIPLIVRADKVFMSQENTGIHLRFRGHFKYRNAFLKRAVRALNLSYPLEAWRSGKTLNNGTSDWTWLTKGEGLQRGGWRNRTVWTGQSAVPGK
ncbi:hypothetical protein CEUSTIGMA_g2131.t1 [Chlamydomonas eustigma]|uniref:Glycosyl transferase 64 domain-containing protein n=1 Tax=Chlamydomonas eustigma TaxID=1157962 RepID=A0A250WV21_9CHLO|nr:hypothetical protein CEUSTIGMA_g2131.t1 [Chlamydomonas eustigma]|eukprot:GAX74683.1 hypothetical protein CEUSTIGMA_g2131.t1 [Chlamydomonas eustigma]